MAPGLSTEARRSAASRLGAVVPPATRALLLTAVLLALATALVVLVLRPGQGDDGGQAARSPATASEEGEDGGAPSSLGANPALDGPGRSLLALLHDATGRSTGRVLSGQHIGGANLASLEVVESIEQRTGRRPAMIGVDLGTGDLGNLTPLVLEHHRAGGFVEVSIHASNPVTGGSYHDLDIDVGRLVTPGTCEHRQWRRQLDGYAQVLDRWQRAGVPILFRPFHEMNSSGFWWSYRNDTVTPATFRALWRQTFEHLTTERGLDNLVWAFTPHIGDPDGRAAAEWYPGDPYVDVVGLDVYKAAYDEVTRQKVEAFHEAFPGRPFIFGEVGPDRTIDAPWDLRVLRDALRDDFPFVVAFMTWNGSRHGMDRLPGAGALLGDPLVVTLEDLEARRER